MVNERRRLFLQQFANAAVTISLGTIIAAQPATAADSSKLDPQGEAAKALGYVESAPNPSKRCGSCQLFKGSSSASWGRCGVFPGKQVKATGWCSAWSA